jgi:cytochrome c oxidase subunit 4
MTSEPVVSVKTYALIFSALLVLTGLTTAVAFVDLGGAWNNSLALTIAIAKAVLVMLYFMHLRYSDKLTWVFAAAGFFWLLILIGGTLDDALTRQQIADGTTVRSTPSQPR